MLFWISSSINKLRGPCLRLFVCLFVIKCPVMGLLTCERVRGSSPCEPWDWGGAGRLSLLSGKIRVNLQGAGGGRWVVGNELFSI